MILPEPSPNFFLSSAHEGPKTGGVGWGLPLQAHNEKSKTHPRKGDLVIEKQFSVHIDAYEHAAVIPAREVFAFDVETLGLENAFTGQESLQAMEGHILASASHMGTYSINPALNG